MFAFQAKKSEPHLFTKEELWKYYRGDKGSKGLYLAFMGKVYDVSAGKTSYQPGGGYDFFAGIARFDDFCNMLMVLPCPSTHVQFVLLRSRWYKGLCYWRFFR